MADTRRKILKAIHEQAQLLNDPAVGSNGEQEQHHWSPQQWWASFTFLFAGQQSTAGHQQHQDDLLFFVRHQRLGAASSPQVFVRRKGKQLPDDLQLSGKDFDNVDWAQTVLLNLVLHSQYQLTVVACGPEALSFVAEGRTWSPGMISVTRPVYASTTVTAVNLDSSRAKDSNPQPCYPDICFAVDNFDNAFEDLVLEDVGRCYCVVLHAILDLQDSSTIDMPDGADVAAHLSTHSKQDTHSSTGNTADQQQSLQQQQQATDSVCAATGAAACEQPAPPAAAAAAAAGVGGRSSSTDDGSGAWKIGTHKRTLFAGYVSFQQILDFMEGSSSRNGTARSLLDALGLKAPKAPQKDKVIMTGPGGMGRCEVAVTKLERPVTSNSSTASSAGSFAAQQQRGGGGGGAAAADSPAAAAAGREQQQQQGLLQRGLQRARVVASGVQQALDVLSELQPSVQAASSTTNMLCALMTLRLPVHHLAQELLAAV